MGLYSGKSGQKKSSTQSCFLTKAFTFLLLCMEPLSKIIIKFLARLICYCHRVQTVTAI